MATVTTTTTISDLSGVEGASSVQFGFEGTNYEIDLTPSEKDAFADALAQCLAVARTVSGKSRKPKKDKTWGAGPDPATVRAWARENGYTIPDRGRIAGTILAAYQAAA